MPVDMETRQAETPPQAQDLAWLAAENRELEDLLFRTQEDLEKYYTLYKRLSGAGSSLNNQGGVGDPLFENVTNELSRKTIEAEEAKILKKLRSLLEEEKNDKKLPRLCSAIWERLAFWLPKARIMRALRQSAGKKLDWEKFRSEATACGIRDDSQLAALIKDARLPAGLKASLYTNLARLFPGNDKAKAASYARLAWEVDPAPYRLKWLAYRLYENNEVLEACAMLNILPRDIEMNETEKYKAMRIRREAYEITRRRVKDQYFGGIA